MAHTFAETSGNIPPTIIGTEAELTTQPLSHTEVPHEVLRRGLAAAGYRYAYGGNSLNNFLSSGARLGADTDIPGYTFLITYASGEELGVAGAAASRQGAPKLLGRVLRAAGVDFNGRHGVPVFGRTGYAHAERNNESTGPHTSFLYEPHPEATGTYYPDFVDRIATYLSTRHVLYGAGMVGEGYLLSQKGPHVSAITPIADGFSWYKPLFQIHSPPKSYGKQNQLRIEDRGGDMVISNWAAFVGVGTTAAFLHAMRHGRRESIDALPVLTDPLQALAQANTIETMHTRLPLADGRHMSIIDIQEAYLEFIAAVDTEHGLPADEKLALTEAQSALNDIRIADVTLIDDRIEWAARLRHISETVPSGGINRRNLKAVEADLRWDIRIPSGPGERYWRGQRSMGILSPAILGRTLVSPSPHTRATWRASQINQAASNDHYTIASWSTIATGKYDGTNRKITTQRDPSGKDNPRTFPI